MTGKSDKPDHELPSKPDSPTKPVDPSYGVPPDHPDWKPDTPGRPDKPEHPGKPDTPNRPGAKPDNELPEPKREAKLSPTEQQRAVLHSNIKRILAQYGNQESNIPMTNEYWGLVNDYRTLTLQPAPQTPT